MVFPKQVVKVQFLGDCYNQGEEWSTGFYMAPLSGNAVLPGNWAQLVSTHWQTFFTAANTSISSRYRTVSIKANLLNADGKQATNPTQEFFYATPIVGTGAGSPMPPQLSVVASLRTDVPRGDATHGRMYLPGVNASVDADARISSTVATNIANGLKTLIDGVNGQTGGGGLRVMLASSREFGTLRQVSKVLVGNLYDTQRRRRNGLQEGYTQANISMGGGSF